MLEKIKQVVSLNCSIEFKTYMNQLNIIIRRDDIVQEQSLPVRDDHFNERKISDCIDFMLGKIMDAKCSVKEDSYHGINAGDVLFFYRDHKLYWYSKTGPVLIQDMTIDRLKNTVAWIERNENKDNQAVKNWISVFKNEIQLRLLKDFKV